MNKKTRSTRRSLLTVGLAVFVFVFALVYAPAFFTSKAVGRKVSQPNAIENYDIRTDTKAADKIANFRARSNRSASAVADMRDSFVQGENELRGRIPSLKVEYSDRLQTPEVIGIESTAQKASLMAQSSAKRPDVLRSFAKENASLVGISNSQADVLKATADYTNPDGNLSFAILEQEIDGIPVFQGEIKAGFNKRGEMFRVINNVAPGLDYESLSREFGDPTAAIRAAAASIDVDPASIDMTPKAVKSEVASADSSRVSFGTGDRATTAEKMYFPTEPGVAIPAWRVMIWDTHSAYYVIVDAQTGTVLWRKNLTDDQTQSATYNVYINPNSMVNVAHSPFPLTPGPIDPSLGTQGSPINRTLVTIVGNESPYTFNQLGWITDGNNTTDGNNVQAGLDRKLPNTGSPANPSDLDPDGVAVGSPNRVFDFPFTPGNPNNNTGDSPLPAGQSASVCLASPNTDLPTDYQKAITTQLFYTVNRYHDVMYLLGFNEAAGNFQNQNFTGQGLGNDRVSAQAQDCSGVSNANFTTPADGNRPTMQMYLWTGPNPDFDGSLDAEVVIHEHTHGLSNRLHGNSSGLSTNMSRGMGEGWSDFYAHSLLSEPNDSNFDPAHPTWGIYSIGGYATYQITGGFTGNYYYGIRRYPKDVIAHTGGVNNKPHNAFTFKYVNSNCNTFLNNTNFAFARGPVGSTTCDQVHNLGEIWSTALWEARGQFITRLGQVEGNRRMLQFVTDGMKLAPLAPTFLTERDAIIAAAQASGVEADVKDLWTGFALRGMGFSATIQNQGNGANDTVVTEAFDLPNLQQIQAITISDTQGNNNGFPEPGEKIVLNVPLTNNTGQPATGVTAQLVGGGSANYGTIANGQSVSQGLSFTVPVGTQCGSSLDVTINVSSSIGPTSFTRSIIVGVPNQTFSENFDAVTVPNLPAGWTSTSVLNGLNFVTSTAFNDTAPNSIFAADPAANAAEADLTSPSIAISAPAATLSFRHRFDTETAWDGGVLEISIAGGAYSDILSAGGVFIANGYNGNMTAATSGGGYTANPLNGRNGWTGNSGGFITTTVRLPAAAAGQNVQFKWRMGADDNTNSGNVGSGWYIDTVKVNGSYNCTVFNTHPKAPYDFDGDGKSDRSVYRPGSGVWYLDRSRDGMTAYQWGLSTDKLVAADYDGDGITDLAVYRPSEGTWWIVNSHDGSVTWLQWGISTDIPVPADYDGDGRADPAVYRGEGLWFVVKSTGGYSVEQWGYSTDIPVPGDYDGDGMADRAIYRGDGLWFVLYGKGGSSVEQWGLATDKPVPADYDGDGMTDRAVYRGEGLWFVMKSGGGFSVDQWGYSTDIPVPADYDGDGMADRAVYRDEGLWFVMKSGGGFAVDQWGLSTDKVVPSALH